MASIYWRSPTALTTDMNTEDYRIPTIDATASRRWLHLPRHEAPWLHEEVGSRMVERLQWLRQPPRSWLHWEPLLGGLQTHQRLRTALIDAPWKLWGVDRAGIERRLAPAPVPWWQPWRAAPASVWAESNEPVEMVWSNMLLHHIGDPMPLFHRWHGHLQDQGLLMFSCLGPQTLTELHQVHERMGWPAPTHQFTDMHDWGDLLVRGGFAEPVVDMERLQLTFSSEHTLLAELRSLGRNLLRGRYPACRGRRWLDGWLDAVERYGVRNAEGRLQLTFEVVYGHAHKVAVRPSRKDPSRIGLDEMRSMLKSGRDAGNG